MTNSRALRVSARCVIALLAAITLVSCGSGSSGRSKSGAGGASPSTPTTSKSSGSTTSAPCPTGTTTEEKTPPSADVAQMTGLTTAAEHCGDDVTFVFRNTPHPSVPGYDVHYATPPFRDSGEGRVHDVQGNAFLLVRFDRASITDFGNPASPLTYTGPTSLHPSGLAHVRDVEILDAAEGVLSWVIGLDAPRPFRVDTTTTAGAVTIAIG